jgi:hypothetical protein
MGQPYENFIFADSDDRLGNDRVLVCRDYLKSFSIVINDIVPFHDDTSITSEGYWSARLSDRQIITSNDIINYNLLGLGNTAIRRDVLQSFVIPDILKAVDWFIFFQWLQSYPAVFVHDGRVHYRQHSGNTVGAKVITPDGLIAISDVKVNHYKALYNDFPYLMKPLLKNEKLSERLKSDNAYCADMAAYLNTKQINYFWWEETEHIHE